MSKFLAWLKGELSTLDENLRPNQIYYEVHGYFPDTNSPNQYPDITTEVYKFPEKFMAIQHANYLLEKHIGFDMFEVTVKRNIKEYRRIWL